MSTYSWTDEQLELLTPHWREMTDAALAKLVSAHGPKRTAKAVECARRTKGWTRRPADQQRAKDRALATYLESVDNSGGWPLLEGTDAEREARYLRLMYEGLQDEHRRLAERAA